MKRVRTHIIEDESDLILRKTFPSEWALRKLSPDYAIDYLVEVFRDQESTGNHFFVQLKGTDQSPKKGQITYQLGSQYIQYYKKLSLPVLLVYISVNTGEIWAKWMNRSSLGKGAKSRRIAFSPKDVLTKERLSALVGGLSTEGTAIRFAFSGMEGTPIRAFAQKWVDALYSEELPENQHVISDEILVKLTKTGRGSISVNVCDERFLAKESSKIPKSYESDALLVPEVDDIPPSLRDFLYSISKVLLVRNSKCAIGIIRRLLPTRLKNEMADVVTVVAKCITSKDYEDVEQLGKAGIDNSNWNMYQFLYMALFKFSSDERVSLIKESLLKYAISRSNDERFTGMLNYNLANHYQSTNRRREAISHYLVAKRKEPEYLNRGYWFRELAGMLFLEKRYSAAARAYIVCLKCERFANEPLTFALAGDAHFMARDLINSADLFEKYIALEEKPDLEFVLKRQAIKTVKDRFGIDGPFFPVAASRRYEELEKQGKLSSRAEVSGCLALDPICPLACFQEAILNMGEGKYDEACIGFLMSALVAEWNVAAWLNSFFMALKAENELMGTVLHLAYKKCGYQVLEVLRSEVLATDMIPADLKSQLVDALISQFKEYDQQDIKKKG